MQIVLWRPADVSAERSGGIGRIIGSQQVNRLSVNKIPLGMDLRAFVIPDNVAYNEA